MIFLTRAVMPTFIMSASRIQRTSLSSGVVQLLAWIGLVVPFPSQCKYSTHITCLTWLKMCSIGAFDCCRLMKAFSSSLSWLDISSRKAVSLLLRLRGFGTLNSFSRICNSTAGNSHCPASKPSLGRLMRSHQTAPSHFTLMQATARSSSLRLALGGANGNTSWPALANASPVSSSLESSNLLVISWNRSNAVSTPSGSHKTQRPLVCDCDRLVCSILRSGRCPVVAMISPYMRPNLVDM
mmetsp:Transcript_4667/g.12170  ORF Transcript_4667/g.12170 Transcript_4667/m.12170 type:complete len:240 (-) Transcript_4667:62-781(-)